MRIDVPTNASPLNIPGREPVGSTSSTAQTGAAQAPEKAQQAMTPLTAKPAAVPMKQSTLEQLSKNAYKLVDKFKTKYNQSDTLGKTALIFGAITVGLLALTGLAALGGAKLTPAGWALLGVVALVAVVSTIGYGVTSAQYHKSLSQAQGIANRMMEGMGDNHRIRNLQSKIEKDKAELEKLKSQPSSNNTYNQINELQGQIRKKEIDLRHANRKHLNEMAQADRSNSKLQIRSETYALVSNSLDRIEEAERRAAETPSGKGVDSGILSLAFSIFS